MKIIELIKTYNNACFYCKKLDLVQGNKDQYVSGTIVTHLICNLCGEEYNTYFKPTYPNKKPEIVRLDISCKDIFIIIGSDANCQINKYYITKNLEILSDGIAYNSLILSFKDKDKLYTKLMTCIVFQ